LISHKVGLPSFGNPTFPGIRWVAKEPQANAVTNSLNWASNPNEQIILITSFRTKKYQAPYPTTHLNAAQTKLKSKQTMTYISSQLDF